MLRVLIIFFFSIVFVSSARSQDLIDSLIGPKIIFEKYEFDFGDVEQGEIVTDTFRFKNTGTDTLDIFNALSTCSCTPVVRDTSKRYAPGESGEIIVSFKTAGKSGVQPKVITVFTNAVNVKSGLLRLFIRVNVIPSKKSPSAPDIEKKKKK